MLLTAWYLVVIVSWQEYPLLIGPYEEKQDCQDMQSWLDNKGYETGECELLPVEQDAILLHIGDIPHER